MSLMACNVEEVLKEVQDRLDKSKKGSEEYNQLLAVKSQLKIIKTVSSKTVDIENTIKDISVPEALNINYGTNENKELSNLAYRPFTYMDKVFESVEHAYQTYKSGTFDEKTYSDSRWKKVRQGDTIKVAGVKGTKTIDNWNIKLMSKLIRESFKQNPEAVSILLDTENKKLAHNQGDAVWKIRFPELLTKEREYFSKLKNSSGNKTGTEMILDQLAKIDGSKISETEGLWVMRNGNPNFGNPFYTVEPKNKLPGDIKVKDNDTASVMYYDWLKNNTVPNGANKKALDSRREVILSNLDKVRTADKLRYAGTAKGSNVNHVKALLAVAEELDKNSINTKTVNVEVLAKAEKTLPKDYYNALNKIVKKVLGPKVTSSKTIAFAKFTLDTYGVIGGQYADGRVTLSKRPNQEALEAEAKGIWEAWYLEHSPYAEFQHLGENELAERLSKDENFQRMTKEMTPKVVAAMLERYANINGMHTLAHELVHVGSAEFMKQNPNHEYTKRVNELYQEALDNKNEVFRLMGKSATDYWTTSVEEFIAEGLSNPDLVYALKNVKTSERSKFSRLFNELLDVLLKMIKSDKGNVHAYLLDGYLAMVESKAKPEAANQLQDELRQKLQMKTDTVQDLENVVNETPLDKVQEMLECKVKGH